MPPCPPGDDPVATLIEDFPLAWVVTPGAATPLPLLAERDGEGRLVSFLGHLARANPQAAAFAGSPEALILFQGPQAYVSPQLAGDPSWAPTWNYAVARFRCRIALAPDETDAALRRLTERMERVAGGGWSVEQLGPRYAMLRERVIAFRARVLETQATFKLGQDERPDVFASIVDGLADRGLAEWMRRARERSE
ncbi:MAG TPA: FMN-binding negative transcriptional regulator [Allosphingosinicella sp.]|nr:FMN-binding negative transcriptional regulator [Allosphingosinicella sp.]